MEAILGDDTFGGEFDVGNRKAAKSALGAVGGFVLQPFLLSTPQLLSMALRYPENKALDILNCFDAGGKYSASYGNLLMQFLNKIDRHYLSKGRVYDDNQYISFQELIHTWIENCEDTHRIITPITFTYFILKYSNGQTVKMIKSRLDKDYDDALSFIREYKLPSFAPITVMACRTSPAASWPRLEMFFSIIRHHTPPPLSKESITESMKKSESAGTMALVF